MRKALSVALGLALVGGVIIASADRAQARPQYLKAFTTQYPDVKDAGKVKCGVCHPEKSKKVRNAYGKAMGGGLGMKNQKDKAKLTEALKKAESMKGEGGKTFGEQLKGGGLPK